jgi:hypothetical protein
MKFRSGNVSECPFDGCQLGVRRDRDNGVAIHDAIRRPRVLEHKVDVLG